MVYEDGMCSESLKVTVIRSVQSLTSRADSLSCSTTAKTKTGILISTEKSAAVQDGGGTRVKLDLKDILARCTFLEAS